MMNTIVPPNDLDAEAAVLSAIFLDSTQIDLLSQSLRPDHFFSHENGDAYEAMLFLRSENRDIDLVTVCGRMADAGRLKADGKLYLTSIVDTVPSVHNAREYALRVIEKAQLRCAIQACREIASSAYGEVDDVAVFLAQACRRLENIGAKDFAGGPVTLGSALQQGHRDLALEIQARIEGRTLNIPTGLLGIDCVTGGLKRGNLDVLAGRPSMGKTALGLNIAINASSQQRSPRAGVLILSLETTAKAVAMRINCIHAGHEVGKVVRADVDAEGMRKLLASADDLSRLPILIRHGSMDLQQIAVQIRLATAHFRNLSQTGEPTELGLVIIDYLQLAEMHQSKTMTRDQAVTHFCQSLKSLALELDIPVLVLAQINRGVEYREDKRPQMSDLRESGGIEAAADTVIMLYRDEYYHPESRDRGVAEAIIRKSRDTETGPVRLAFRAEWLRFTDLEDEEDD